jgi:heavy metal sensor kinase
MLRQRIRHVTFFRTLRFRLAGTFLLLLTLVLLLVGVVVTTTLHSILNSQSEEAVRDQLGQLKSFVEFDDHTGKPYLNADRTDPEEDATVGRLIQVYVIADDRGNIELGVGDPALEDLYKRETIMAELKEIRRTKEPYVKTVIGKDRVPYEVASSILINPKERHHPEWYVAEGRSLKSNEDLLRKFRRNYFIFFPLALIACTWVSWYSAGRALRALQSVEEASREIKGSNLGLQIPKRGADDELDHLIESFNQMSHRLKASFEQIRQFSTDVSHELRTPLTAIQGQLEVALFTATRPEQLREAIENALQDVERLTNLVRALLLLSQSESGQIPMNKTVVDLGYLMAEIVEQFQIPAEAQDIQLVWAGSGPVLCEADQTQLERVITNLLSNALKYTPSGGRIKARAETNGTSVKLIVEDSGVGIPADHLPYIFDRFYRVPDPNPEKGLGLGLSFVSSIVKAHGGEIQVTSEVGKGSRFEITLPAGAVHSQTETPVMQE